MNELHDISKLKRSRKIVKDLENVIHILKLAYKTLNPYREYTSLQETLLCLQDSKMILEIHMQHHEQILKDKGKVNEET